MLYNICKCYITFWQCKTHLNNCPVLFLRCKQKRCTVGCMRLIVTSSLRKQTQGNFTPRRICNPKASLTDNSHYLRATSVPPLLGICLCQSGETAHIKQAPNAILFIAAAQAWIQELIHSGTRGEGGAISNQFISLVKTAHSLPKVHIWAVYTAVQLQFKQIKINVFLYSPTAIASKAWGLTATATLLPWKSAMFLVKKQLRL